MNVTLTLKPETEEHVVAQAAALGVPVESYLQQVIEQTTPQHPPQSSIEEFERMLDALAEGSEDRPILPPEAFTRESIYGDHD